jgi:hypothetical protein
MLKDGDIFECRRNARDLGMIEQSSETFFERRWVSKITGTFNGDDFIWLASTISIQLSRDSFSGSRKAR